MSAVASRGGRWGPGGGAGRTSLLRSLLGTCTDLMALLARRGQTKRTESDYSVAARSAAPVATLRPRRGCSASTSAITASVSAPSGRPARSTEPGVRPRRATGPGIVTPSTSTNVPRSRTWSSARRSAIVYTGAIAACASLNARSTSDDGRAAIHVADDAVELVAVREPTTQIGEPRIVAYTDQLHHPLRHRLGRRRHRDPHAVGALIRRRAGRCTGSPNPAAIGARRVAPTPPATGP